VAAKPKCKRTERSIVVLTTSFISGFFAQDRKKCNILEGLVQRRIEGEQLIEEGEALVPLKAFTIN
jgi:hypothetical protein